MSFARTLEALYTTLLERAAAGDAEASYTARLLSRGTPLIAKKLGEEGVEVALAAIGEDDVALTGEIADLLYHLLVLMIARGIAPDDVGEELAQRFGLSGISEKAHRADRPA
jgi:phosphoribosyl-ATP pyrophosphohydrolase